MLEYHGWVSLQDSAGLDDEEDDPRTSTVQAVTTLLAEALPHHYLADVRGINVGTFVTLAGFPNHGRGFVLLDVYRRIGELAPGSYGVLHVYDDEAAPGDDFLPDDPNAWFTYVMVRGAVRRHRDTFLSPHVPTVEDG